MPRFWKTAPWHVGGRLVRKLVFLFVLAAFVPLVMAFGLGYWYVSGVVVSREHASMVTQAELAAAAVSERLLLLEDTLRLALAHAGEHDVHSGNAPFVSVRPASQEQLAPLLAAAGLSPERFAQHLAARHAALLVTPGGGVILVMNGQDLQPWLGEVRPGLLEHGDGAGAVICWPVLSATRFTCGMDTVLARALEARLPARDSAPVWFETQGGRRVRDHVAVRVPVNERFLGAGVWSVVTQARTTTVDLLLEWRRLWLLVIGTAVAFVAALSVWQMRRVLVPVKALLEGMRRFARRDFSQPITVADSDEFAALADHLNVLGERLERQFDVMHRLAEIDRLILSDPDILRVAERVMEGLRSAFHGGQAIVCLRMNVDSDEWLVAEPGDAGDVVLRWQSLEGQVTALEGALPEGVVRAHQWPAVMRVVNCLVITSPAAEWWVAPMGVSNRFLGAVLLREDVLDADDLKFLREYADRLAVAVINVDRAGRLYRQAHYDDLTGLPNRQLMKDRLRWAIASAHRQQRKIAVLFIDIDDFKKVNDSAGHRVGDQLLQKVSERMRVCVREGDTVSRQGGDEFIVILPFLDGDSRAQRVAERIIHLVSSPFVFEGREFYVGASIGIAVYPEDGDGEDALLMNADMAMYRAKNHGKNQFRYFEEQMQAMSQERMLIEKELRIGIREKQFLLHYQPQWNGVTQSWSVEALARWMRPGAGLVSPAVFIGIAEETGLILDIGEQLMEEACRQFLQWRNEGIALTRVAVNVSGRQLMRSDYVQRLGDVLERTGMNPACLEIELTESVLLKDIDLAAAKLSQLKSLGIRIAIDDFGTGYSSLSYVQRLPIDVLKIDRSFISPLPEDTNTLNVVKAVIDMGHALDREVVAEGVETVGQAELLLSLGCDVLQGYHFSRPLPSDYCALFVGDGRDR